jgi:hypothetical protein
MATATIIDVPGVESKHPRGLLPPPPAFRTVARSFRCLSGVGVVWLAVRESRSQTAVICWSQGSRSMAGLEMRIEPGVGVGGALLVTGEPWQGELTGGGDSALSTQETALLNQEAVKHVLVVPLRYIGLRGKSRTGRAMRRARDRTSRSCARFARLWRRRAGRSSPFRAHM